MNRTNVLSLALACLFLSLAGTASAQVLKIRCESEDDGVVAARVSEEAFDLRIDPKGRPNATLSNHLIGTIRQGTLAVYVDAEISGFGISRFGKIRLYVRPKSDPTVTLAGMAMYDFLRSTAKFDVYADGVLDPEGLNCFARGAIRAR